MVKRTLIYVVIVAVGLTSCSILGSDSSSADSRIVGGWQLIRSSGGITGQVLTPDSTEFNESHIYYRSDNSFSVTEEDSVTREGKYDLTKKDGDLFITYTNEGDGFSPNQYLSFEAPDTLKLADQCFDCYITIYKRTE